MEQEGDGRMKIARVVTTWRCHRDCDLCCNKKLLVEPRPCSIADLTGYDQVLLTGGEPMLYPEQVVAVARELRLRTPPKQQRIYLYSALAHPAFPEVLKWIDGVHFTLHHPLMHFDLEGFKWFQGLLVSQAGLGKSFRLYVDPRIDRSVKIVPNRWARVEVKPWLDECPLPENEEFFELGGLLR